MNSNLKNALLLLEINHQCLHREELELIQAAQILLEKKKTCKSCDYCKTKKTPMWRHGPRGYEDLCNKVFIRIYKVWCKVYEKENIAGYSIMF
jgi:hypothetical protein